MENSNVNKSIELVVNEHKHFHPTLGDRLALVKKIGRTTYRVHIHFSTTSTETMSDKIKRMQKNEIQQM